MKTNVQLSPESEHASFLHTAVLFFYGQLQESKTLTHPLAQEYLCVGVCGGNKKKTASEDHSTTIYR